MTREIGAESGVSAVSAANTVGAASVILGQVPAVQSICRAMQRGRMHHAWIFHGPVGVGKFTTALRLARILLDPEATADHAARFEPPLRTEVARLIDAGTHPDLHVIRKELAAASSLRELRDRKQINIPLDLLRERMLGGLDGGGSNAPPVFRTPFLGHGKVFIIDEAELLEVEAQNAMLKTLEEPPERTWILLCSQQEDRLLPTIRSRCQRVSFGPLPASAMAQWWLGSGRRVDAEDRSWIDAFAAGSPGMAALAVDAGLHGAWMSLRPALDALERGSFDATLADRMAEFIDGHAKQIVKENEQASKEAANRAGARLLLAMLGAHVRERLQTATAAAQWNAAERWIEIAARLQRVDDELRANLNLKHVMAHLVAQWAAIIAPAPARASTARAAG